MVSRTDGRWQRNPGDLSIRLPEINIDLELVHFKVRCEFDY